MVSREIMTYEYDDLMAFCKMLREENKNSEVIDGLWFFEAVFSLATGEGHKPIRMDIMKYIAHRGVENDTR